MTQNPLAVAAGSYGEILFDPNSGVVLGFGWQQGSHPQGHYDDIDSLDVVGWMEVHGSAIRSDTWIDILEIGFWFRRPDGLREFQPPASAEIPGQTTTSTSVAPKSVPLNNNGSASDTASA